MGHLGVPDCGAGGGNYLQLPAQETDFKSQGGCCGSSYFYMNCNVKYKCDFQHITAGVHVAQRTDLQVDVPIDQGSSPVVQVGVPDCGAGGGNYRQLPAQETRVQVPGRVLWSHLIST